MVTSTRLQKILITGSATEIWEYMKASLCAGRYTAPGSGGQSSCIDQSSSRRGQVYRSSKAEPASESSKADTSKVTSLPRTTSHGLVAYGNRCPSGIIKFARAVPSRQAFRWRVRVVALIRCQVPATAIVPLHLSQRVGDERSQFLESAAHWHCTAVLSSTQEPQWTEWHVPHLIGCGHAPGHGVDQLLLDRLKLDGMAVPLCPFSCTFRHKLTVLNRIATRPGGQGVAGSNPVSPT
ncbi:hypothetical protein SAMN05421541_108108 [Actinoplanes philippinensis]|uniref:Uncharacterized protein n=1 Tax=Actinoplanes philippinensis TaxID=35752 RepID=A0A1I2HHF1_9ACTN|nr:hypothetical protein SAMN05421541_108108 [Actinoplanes philippinensis]